MVVTPPAVVLGGAGATEDVEVAGLLVEVLEGAEEAVDVWVEAVEEVGDAVVGEVAVAVLAEDVGAVDVEVVDDVAPEVGVEDWLACTP